MINKFEQIEQVYFDLKIENNTLFVNIAYTFLPDEIDQKIKANKKLNFKKSFDYKDIDNLTLLFSFTNDYNISVDFLGTKALREASKNTQEFIKQISRNLLAELCNFF